MHRIPSQNLALRSTQRGFSLPEIAMSLAVLSIAFVSLFALLPYGLTSFRAAIDTSNETWIMQSINSMVQTTEWEKLWGPNSQFKDEIYYFDEEGRLTDTESNPSNKDSVRRSRLYQAKLFFEPLYRPTESATTEPFIAINNETEPVAVRVIVVLVSKSNPKGIKIFTDLTSAAQIPDLPSDSGVTIRSFVATEMNSVI
jgi:prepilin-type N-terminal cleavage/methylation domain-containing protein